MNRTKLATTITAVVVSFILLVPSIAMAIDWSFTGFVRQEIAVSITDDKNPNNASTNAYTEGATPAYTFGLYNPEAVAGTGLGANGLPSDERGIFSAVSATCPYFTGASALAEIPGFGAGGVNSCQPNPGGNGIAEDSNINLFNTRAEFDIQANNITRSINAFAKIRLYFDGTSNFNDEIVGDHFKEQFYGNRGNLLEINSNDIGLDIPSLYFDYNKGPLWIRVGQQQIAWGEALFFRVFDVANGLDTRRHFFLDVASEEYADERVASPGVRVSYTFKNGIEIDAFVQMFSPTLLPGLNTTYNLVTSGFSWDNEIELDEAKNTLNYGMRVIWPVTDSLTVQAMAVNRRNPDGIVRWHDAPATLDNGRPNPFCSGRTAATVGPALQGLGAGNFSATSGVHAPFAGALTLSASEIATLNTPTGGLARTKYTENGCGSFFAPDALGGTSGSNWYDIAPQARLDSAAVVAASINLTQVSSLEARKVFGLQTETSAAAVNRFGSVKGAAHNTLDAFYTGFGPLRGWITREFKRETILGVGGNYIFTSENEWLDQLVLRGEMSYTPDKQFTALDLSGSVDRFDGSSTGWIEEDEFVASIIAEKYHRWSENAPAMFMVAEWMHKTQSDLFGRHLSGSENTPGLGFCTGPGAVGGAGGSPNATYCDDGRPDGSDSFNAVAFAFQQPFPDLIWRLDAAFLLDLEGGWFFQPGVRYRPSAHWQFDLYANIAQDGGNKNDDIIETFDWADEVFVRATYFF